MTEQPLAGGYVSGAVRVGDTVRRASAPESTDDVGHPGRPHPGQSIVDIEAAAGLSGAEPASGQAAYLAEFEEPDGYLDFARFGPPSRAVHAATTTLLRDATRASMSTVDDLMAWEPVARAGVARLCGARVERVVLLPHTSQGLFQAAFQLDGEVLVSAAEFPANTYPWARAEQAGLVRVRWLRPEGGLVTPASVAAALTPEITAVSVSAVDFRTGHLADLAGLREVAGERLLVVDGTQAFGAVCAPWEAADILVAGGQKWLRAGWGTAFAVLSERALDRSRPLMSGWTGARDPGVFDDRVHEPAAGAAAWSISNLSPVVSGALAAAVEVVERVGVAAVQDRIAQRVGELEQVVRSAGARVVSATGPRGGILTFTLPGAAAALAAHGVTATVRGETVRLSPHASTTPATIDAVRAALAPRWPRTPPA